MPSKKAKARKLKRRQLNEKWKKEGRTANQQKKWLEKNEGKSQHQYMVGNKWPGIYSEIKK